MRLFFVLPLVLACSFSVAEANSQSDRMVKLIGALPADLSRQDAIDCYGTAYVTEQTALAAEMPKAVAGAQISQSIWSSALVVRFNFNRDHQDILNQTSSATANYKPGEAMVDFGGQGKVTARSCMLMITEASKVLKADGK